MNTLPSSTDRNPLRLKSWQFDGLVDTAVAMRSAFERDGYVVLGSILSDPQIRILRSRFAAVFRGEFETGNQPDAWYWQEGTSHTHLPRHMANAWKADLEIARYVLSADLARCAGKLMGWNSVKLAQDTLWLQPPMWPEGEFHQDSLEFLDPPDGLTCWLTLDDTKSKSGTLQYVRKSHLWTVDRSVLDITEGASSDMPRSRIGMLKIAAAVGVENPEIIPIDVKAGTLVAHRSNTWHASDANELLKQARRAIGVHFIHPHSQFNGSNGGYIYGRYKLLGSVELNESFFPITWVANGKRRPSIDHYCETGELG